MILITSGGGPQISGDLRLYPVLGAVVMFFGLVLGLRVMVVALRSFESDRWPHS